MRRPSSRKAPRPLSKPDFFPPENVLERELSNQLVGERVFEQYHFLNFDLSQFDLVGRRFSDCLFENCNLAGSSLRDTALQNVAFAGCKLLGLPFHTCREMLFAVHFDQCQLDYASFWARAMPNTRFMGCSLREADFTGADLTNAVFQECSLLNAVFSQTKLPAADFTTAHDVVLDPELNELQQARFALHGLPGLLAKHGLVIS